MKSLCFGIVGVHFGNLGDVGKVRRKFMGAASINI